MPTLPKADDVQKIREQATHALEGAVGQARQPLLAALGAGDLAAQAVKDTLVRIRTELDKRAESARADLPSDLNELREQLEPGELRKRLDAYTQSAVKLYDYLAERGEGALERIQSQPQVQRARTQAEAAQEKVGEVADDVLGKVTRATRSYGEKAAEQTEEVAEEVAEAVQEAGDKAATATRSTSRKAANKTASAKTGAAKKPATATSKTTTPENTES